MLGDEVAHLTDQEALDLLAKMTRVADAILDASLHTAESMPPLS